MNKFTKGAIATGAGIMLLLGGAGTFAYWNDTAAVSAGTVTAGTLTLTAGSAGVWTDVSADVSGAPVISPSTVYLAVPGDTIKYTRTYTIAATGKNLAATLAVNTAGVTTGTWTSSAVATTVIKVNGVAGTAITSANDGQTVTVEVTIAFDKNAGNATKGGTVDLTALQLSVTQNTRP